VKLATAGFRGLRGNQRLESVPVAAGVEFVVIKRQVLYVTDECVYDVQEATVLVPMWKVFMRRLYKESYV